MELPFFPFYAADFFTKTYNLSDEQAGRYIRLLCLQWINGPVDNVPPYLTPYFKKIKKNGKICYINERLEDEKSKTVNRRKQAKDAADMRWHKRPDMRTDMRTDMPKPMLSYPDPDPDPELEPKTKPKKGLKVEKIKTVFPDAFNSDMFRQAWEVWKDYKKKEHNFKYKSEISERAALGSLLNKSGGDLVTALTILKVSIQNGWRGFFTLKNEDKKELINIKNVNEFNDLREKYGL